MSFMAYLPLMMKPEILTISVA